MSHRVLILGESDIGDLMELEAICFDYHWTHDQFLLGLRQNAFRVLGVRQQTALVAYLAFSLIEDEMEILNLAVHPECRRQGLAETLLETAFDMCREKGINKSFLDVKESNVPALALYRKFGYSQYGVRKKYYPDTKEDALLFRYDFDKDNQ